MNEPPSVSDISIPALVISAVALITLSMLFSVSESAFLSVNKLRLRVRCRAGNKRALRVARLLKNKELMINTLLVSNDLVNVMLSAILTAFALKVFGSKAIAITTFAATLLLLLFGEITPKAVCTRHPDPIAYGLSGFVQFIVFVMRPVVLVFTAVSRLVLFLRGIKVKNEQTAFTVEDIKTFLDVSAESGIIEHGEKNLMNRVFKFTDLEAQDIMIPRKQITFVHIDDSYDKVLELSRRTLFSRFPVYRRDIDDIVGTVYIKDLLFYSGDKKSFSLRSVMRPPLFILETKNMSSTQQILRENRQTMAIVVDEYSGTEGILTKEDIAAEMFGAGISEFSKAANVSSTIPVDSNEFELEGTTRLSDINEALRVNLFSDINESVGGWIMERIGRIAEVGDKVVFDGWIFIVKKLDGFRIEKVLLVREKEDSQDSEDNE
ncbi:MAG: hemolysin family protein [Treponema sp.]|nr:hemolysin family protein [Treponema sp.]MEE3434330.1 hemolysin family protein [Treponema sp.]